MLTNYFKIAWRNLIRNKTFSFINILGLSVGLTCCMLLLLYIRSELSFDQHHERADDLYLVGQRYKIGRNTSGGGEQESGTLSAPYAFALKAEYPEIEQVGRLWVNLIDEKALLQVREPGQPVRSFYETRGYQIDSTFFDLVTYQFLEGDARTAMKDPNSIVLSDALAKKLFGEQPALNRILRIGGTAGAGQDFKVSGVYRDESHRSHIDARFFVSIYAGWVGRFLRRGPLDFANNNMFQTYLRLKPGTDPRALEAKLPAFLDKYARKDLNANGGSRTLFLVALPDIHLYSKIQTVITPTNSTTYLYILGSIAIFTLLIACVNFMNLATARSAKRAAEVGVRKVMGAEQQALVRQFLGESMLMTLIALLIAVLLVMVFLPLFNQLTNRTLSAWVLLDPRIALTFLGLALVTGLLAGSYPAFYLSMLNPARVLKGKVSHSLSAVMLRRGLVVFQFLVSVGLVLATFVIDEQMDYMRNKSLGFTQDQQIVVPFRSAESRGMYTAFRSEVLRNSQVVSASGTQYYPGIANASDFILHRSDQTIEQGKDVRTNWVDFEYLETMGFQLKTGRGFSRQFPGDTNNRMVVNEATLRRFEIPVEKAIGEKLIFDWQGQQHPFEIVGVVKDFHFEDLHKTIEPYAFMLNNRPDFNYLIIHVNTDRMAGLLTSLEQKWKALRPDEPFEYTFLNEDFQKNFQAEARTAGIVNAFTIISILISCLGLFGLAAFAAQQRTKEIGVRKVLGASVADIVLLLSTDFLKLVLLAILIASPLAWWAMDRWLQDFAYKISIEWWVFLVAGGLAIAIALLTVSFQSIRAALANPVRSLKSE